MRESERERERERSHPLSPTIHPTSTACHPACPPTRHPAAVEETTCDRRARASVRRPRRRRLRQRLGGRTGGSSAAVSFSRRYPWARAHAGPSRNDDLLSPSLQCEQPQQRDCMGGGPREVAEHFVELHSSRIIGEESSRGRLHSSRKDYLSPNDLKLEEVVSYLERVRDRAERSAPPSRRTQETQTVPAALLPVSSTFLLQELPSTPPQHLHQNSASMPGGTGSASGGGGGGTSSAGGGGGGGGSSGGGNNASGKRYTCLYCPYGTDRRDLYTRHENIHREEKPFHCYVCYKPFSRADHVKKHFLRMHREHTYELSRIRRPAGSASSTPKPPANVQSSDQSSGGNPTSGSNNNNNNATSPYSSSLYPGSKQPLQPISIGGTTTYHLQPPPTSSVHTASAALYQAASLSSAVAAAAAAAANASNIMQQQQQQQQPEANCGSAAPVTIVHNAQAARRLQNGGCNSKSHLKTAGGGSSKANQERRYTCCYCSWSGVDNWCLKRHLNTHLKPFACALCEYKAARAERLATHVLKVHNRRQCSRCSFLAEDLTQLQVHQLHVHRVSNASVVAAAAAAASATAQQQSSAAAQQQNQNNERQQPLQPQPIHPVGSGRPPPGPPVFPASSAAIAPATTVIPPTTILGIRSEIASMPGNACWEQESSSCEERFGHSNERRSRKQRKPRKIMTSLERLDATDTVEASSITPQETGTKELEDSNPQPKRSRDSNRRPALFRCFLCPKNAAARAYRSRPYHSRESLLLHKLWRHNKMLRRRKKDRTAPVAVPVAPASITLRATVYTERAFEYQR